MEKNQITGIVLCGGKSSRMGIDKALLPLGDNNLLEMAILTIEPLCGNILISANSIYPLKKRYQFIKDKFDNIGPLSGIYSSLAESETEHNIIISCDTPFLSSNTISYILQNIDNYDIVLPQVNGYIQSLTGYFNRSVLPFIEEEIKKLHYKPIQMFMEMNCKILTFDNSLDFYKDYLFMNINSLENYIEALRIFRNISL
jgi:molybdopterin-guanine dinucleotide biosynthesis protein A